MDLKYIKQKADILEVIGHFVPLKKSGANYVAHSPFSDERTPSFTVSKAKGIFKCFSSGESGDVIDFVSKIKNFGITEAAKWVENFCNLPQQETDWSYVPPPVKPISYFNPLVLQRTMSNYPENKFIQWLHKKFKFDAVQKAIKLYKIGSSNHIFRHTDHPGYTSENGACIFWQVDYQQRIRSGKIMLYNPSNGKRIKQPFAHIIYAHKAFGIPDFNFKYCHFGEHLAALNPENPICIVESEKTAIVASILFPEYIWIATTASTCITPDSCAYLLDRNVIFIPDSGTELLWEKQIKNALKEIKCNWHIRPLAGPQPKGYDLCDWITDYKTKPCSQENTN